MDRRSRHQFSFGVRDAAGRLHLTERAPYRYTPHPDNRVHVVEDGDTLFALAGRYFAPLERPAGYWWALADFQRPPIVDPTLRLEVGRRLDVPSVRVLRDVILGDARRPGGL